MTQINARNIFSQFLWRAGLSETVRKAWGKKTRFVLVMHGVSRVFNPQYPKVCQPHHDYSGMHAVLTWLGARYQFLSAEKFLNTNQPGVLLTFDDGFANNYDVLLPLIEQFSAPALLFVSLQHIMDPKDWLPATRKIASQKWPHKADVPDLIARDWYDGMSLTQLRVCAAHPLLTIGSHTFSHPFLSKCTEAELNHEIYESKIHLENLLNQPIEFFAYPTGDYDSRSIEAVKKAGYKAAFAVDRLGLSSFRYEIPRIGIYTSDHAYLSLKLSGLYRRPLRAEPVL